MRFYTKAWYELMQHQNYTICARRIPDGNYSEEEIRALYREQLDAEIAQDRRDYDTPPQMLDISQQLTPETFDPEDWMVFPEGEDQEPRHPASLEEVLAQLEREKREAEEAFASRPPFDPAESEAVFRTAYRARLRHCAEAYPDWVCRSVDRRLLALDLLPESVYRRLQREEAENQKALQAIEAAAEEELCRQQIPEHIAEAFCFHDGALLSLRKRGRDYEMLLRKDGGWVGEGVTPYTRVLFRDAAILEREKGLVPRPRKEADGTWWSNCTFLYHELYAAPDGYEVHMLFAAGGRRALNYLTVACKDISFTDNAVLPA